jgi:hypothetical protein
VAPGWTVYGFLGGQNPTFSLPEQYAWSTDQQSLSTSVIACHDGCTLHSNEVHEAIQLLHEYRPTQAGSNGWTPGYSSWTLVPAMPVQEPGGIPWPVANARGEVVQPPVARVMGDTELLTICKSIRFFVAVVGVVAILSFFFSLK